MAGKLQEQEHQLVRDMSRPEWQRGIGAVIFRVVGDTLFADGELTVPDMDQTDIWAARNEREKAVDPFWYRAHDAIETMLKGRRAKAADSLPPEVGDGLRRFTHFGYQSRGEPYDVISESVAAQVHFPLNLAQIISVEAEEREVSGFAVRSYSDVADVLDRSDVRLMIDQALLAKNGAWPSLSTEKGISRRYMDIVETFNPSVEARDAASEIVFDEQGRVAWQPRLLERLRDELRRVNREGNSNIESCVTTLASSGCPARHQQPSETAIKPHEMVLAKLVAATGKSRQELIGWRPTSVVEDGLTFMSTILRDFEAYASGEKTTYSGSAESPASAGRLAVGRAQLESSQGWRSSRRCQYTI